ncbi:unnamed protein product [Arctia plantaginis]|uniref:Uncharacterized protein n=1 Tax=Arctia plantaginis TaxID=874455 RepID=A0A8S1B9X6_ARCPL|nr:unnamed protein product [Arctia plantaginis]
MAPCMASDVTQGVNPNGRRGPIPLEGGGEGTRQRSLTPQSPPNCCCGRILGRCDRCKRPETDDTPVRPGECRLRRDAVAPFTL